MYTPCNQQCNQDIEHSQQSWKSPSRPFTFNPHFHYQFHLLSFFLLATIYLLTAGEPLLTHYNISILTVYKSMQISSSCKNRVKKKSNRDALFAASRLLIFWSICVDIKPLFHPASFRPLVSKTVLTGTRTS